MSAVLEQPLVEQPIPETLSVNIPVTGELMTGIRLAGAVAEANVWEIDSPEMAQLAANQRTDWAKRIDQIKKMRTDFLDPAKKIVEAAAKWFNPPIEDMEAGRQILGQKLLTWDQQEKDRIAAERRRIEDEQRRIRQEAEAKAAAERARAEEQAREQRRKEQEALEAQRRAIAEGNAKAAAKAAADAARAAEQAQAALENGAAKAAQTELEAAAKASAAPAPEATKIEGSSVKANWVAVLDDGFTEETALAAIVKAIVTENRADLLALLKIDTAPRGPLNKLAAALKKSMRVPGYIARDVPTLAGARK